MTTANTAMNGQSKERAADAIQPPTNKLEEILQQRKLEVEIVLPSSLIRIVFPDKKLAPDYQPWHKSSLSNEENTRGHVIREKWANGERSLTYDVSGDLWSAEFKENSNEYNLLKRADKSFFLSGKIGLLDLRVLVENLLDEKGESRGLVSVSSLKQRLDQQFSENEDSVDFSKMGVFIEFKFSTVGYEITKVSPS